VQSELTFREMNGISALFAVMTPDGAVEDVNRAVLDYFGKTLEELKQWASTDAVHPDDLPGVIAVWSRSLESGEPYDLELRQRGADSVYRWFRVHGTRMDASFVGAFCRRISRSESARKACSPERISF
jgi:PAS domain S-box-containing protein